MSSDMAGPWSVGRQSSRAYSAPNARRLHPFVPLVVAQTTILACTNLTNMEAGSSEGVLYLLLAGGIALFFLSYVFGTRRDGYA